MSRDELKPISRSSVASLGLRRLGENPAEPSLVRDSPPMNAFSAPRLYGGLSVERDDKKRTPCRMLTVTEDGAIAKWINRKIKIPNEKAWPQPCTSYAVAAIHVHSH